MKLRELLERKEFEYKEVITIGPDEMVSEAIKKMIKHDRGSLPVCEETGELVGIVTERDVARKCATNEGCAILKIHDVMSPDVITASPEDDLDYAIDIMKKKRIRHLPIWENKKLVGVVSMRDLLLLHMALI